MLLLLSNSFAEYEVRDPVATITARGEAALEGEYRCADWSWGIWEYGTFPVHKYAIEEADEQLELRAA